MQRAPSRPARRLAMLDEDEARFVDIAFALLLPEDGPALERMSCSAAEFVDARLQAGNGCLLYIAVDLGAGDLRLTGMQVATAYHRGIEAVQRHCLASRGKAFHELERPQQRVVLGLLEREAPDAGFRDQGILFLLLVQHAAEAYFEAVHGLRPGVASRRGAQRG